MDEFDEMEQWLSLENLGKMKFEETESKKLISLCNGLKWFPLINHLNVQFSRNIKAP